MDDDRCKRVESCTYVVCNRPVLCSSGAAVVAQISALHTNTTLKFLCLVGNRINDVGAQALAEALKNKNTTLTSLNIATREQQDQRCWEGDVASNDMWDSPSQLRVKWPSAPPSRFQLELLQASRQWRASPSAERITAGGSKWPAPRPARVTALRWRAAARGDARCGAVGAQFGAARRERAAVVGAKGRLAGPRQGQGQGG